MDVSVIIVNYNVRYFIEQAIQSVRKASHGLEVEIIVVDNASSDGSVEMIRQRFSEVHLLVNEENVGFSKANNQGIEKARGTYTLLLNPDTILQEDTLNTVHRFMEQHPETGAAGVRMIDGSGEFLPESKRGFPTPFVAFCKAFGLSALFPQSSMLNYYHLGHLDADKNQTVDVLCGAFMFIRSTVLHRVGGLDESFFMYGEDIDLSYRMQKAGFENAYIADTSIIHFKGESTKKTSSVYIRRFYEAMHIFARKHFSQSGATLVGILFSTAIYFRGALTFLSTVGKRLKWIVLDLALMVGAIWGTKVFWASFYYGNPDYYPPSFLYSNLPFYAAIWFFAHFLSGGYDRSFRMGRLLRGHLIGTLFLLALYGLLPEDWRTSRAIILISAVLVWAVLWTTKRLKKQQIGKEAGDERPRNLALVSSIDASQKIVRLLDRAKLSYEINGILASEAQNYEEEYVTEVANLPDYVRANDIDEVIFNADENSMQDIMDWMGRIGEGVDIKIVSSEGEGIIGSSSIHTAGELYAVQIQYQLNDPVYRRYKRIADVLVCCSVSICFPLWPWINPSFLKNWFSVLIGKKTWVGYLPEDQNTEDLPDLKESVFPFRSVQTLNSEAMHRINTLYARDYQPGLDLNLLRQLVFKNTIHESD